MIAVGFVRAGNYLLFLVVTRYTLTRTCHKLTCRDPFPCNVCGFKSILLINLDWHIYTQKLSLCMCTI